MLIFSDASVYVILPSDISLQQGHVHLRSSGTVISTASLLGWERPLLDRSLDQNPRS